ncbi:MAG: transglycosylase domain-containing protein [Gammaproteobacteria bacterium]|nr:transglycosylase domain-containing protein [Gammaproteobacteria bacterium]
MKTLLKGFTIVVIAGFLLSLAGLLAYDIFVFSPHSDEIHGLIENANSEDRDPPKIVEELISASHGKPLMVSSFVARQLLLHFEFENSKGTLRRHARTLIWWSLAYLHLNESETFALYCALVWNGKDQGLNKLSQRLFDNSISELTEMEAATVVAVLASPAMMLRDEQRLHQRRDYLLEQIVRMK